jgi:hypothetical protein
MANVQPFGRRQEQVGFRFGVLHLVACHDGGCRKVESERLHRRPCRVHSAAGRNRKRNLSITQRVQQRSSTRQRPDVANRALVGVRVTALQSFDPLSVELEARLAQQHVREQTAAHADLAMNPPDRQFDAFGVQGFLPRQYVLVDAVDESAIQIEHESRFYPVCHCKLPNNWMRVSAGCKPIVSTVVQYHEILRYEDPHRIFDEEGAHAALVAARQAGKLRYIGFTGHKDPHIHLYMLEVAGEHGFTFDAVQMPLNVMDAHYRSFERLVVPELVKQNVGVLGMKSLGNGVILKSGAVTAIECLLYALSLPTSVVITGIESMERLDQAFEAVRTFRPMSDAQRDALLRKTAAAASRGEFELFKTTSVFDATSTSPAWLGEEPQRVRQVMPQ